MTRGWIGSGLISAETSFFVKTQKLVGKKILIRGIVQGVGFRPTVYTYASQAGISGWVRNTSNGVEIQAGGTQEDLEQFVVRLRNNPPPLAQIDMFQVEDCPPPQNGSFQILESHPSEGDFIPISPDLATCPDCLRELFDPNDRRFRYPFINCTNCGPRYTIIEDIPYDRPKTTMAPFHLCPECEREYQDPANRRFHAQPVACPVCGPSIWLEVKGNMQARGDDAIRESRNLIRAGKVVALKGLGGYHLACNAFDENAVSILRARKNRIQKPFALMAANLSVLQEYAHLSPAEEALLCSPESPIVILEKKGDSLPGSIAPGQNSLGFMLPYTPLHHLLLESGDGFPQVLVMTSGNLVEEPIDFQDAKARLNLSSLADAILIHDRGINIRTDDSVVREFQSSLYPIRRARGYAPAPIQLPFSVDPILAVGAELKNTVAVARDTYAFLSHHIGDLENLETMDSFEQAIPHLEHLFRVKPRAIACDLHPDYRSSMYARDRFCTEEIPLIQVQHHHAHLASCLADNGWSSEDPVIGVCFDGTGLGLDGSIWGGEFLVGNYVGFERKFHLAYTPLPGGDSSIKHPYKTALAFLWKAGLDWDDSIPSVRIPSPSEQAVLWQQLDQSINTPMTSSVGRLFDAVSSLLGLCQDSTYEGEAAIRLENSVDPAEQGTYDLDFLPGQIDPTPMIRQIIRDFRGKVPIPVISARFHNTMAGMVLETVVKIQAETKIPTVALSGGVWQNMTLLKAVDHRLTHAGFVVLHHRQVPANDGGISLGQVAVASAQILKGK